MAILKNINEDWFGCHPKSSRFPFCLFVCFSLTERWSFSVVIAEAHFWPLTYLVINFHCFCQPHVLLKQTHWLILYLSLGTFWFSFCSTEREALGLFIGPISYLLPSGHLINVCIIISISISKSLLCVAKFSLRSWIIYIIDPLPRMALLPCCKPGYILCFIWPF